MIRLIASDVDGTLLGRGEDKIDTEVFDLINAVSDLGVLFVIASGRPYCELKHLFEPVMDKIALVCSDGALTVYHGKNVLEMQMDLLVVRFFLWFHVSDKLAVNKKFTVRFRLHVVKKRLRPLTVHLQTHFRFRHCLTYTTCTANQFL